MGGEEWKEVFFWAFAFGWARDTREGWPRRSLPLGSAVVMEDCPGCSLGHIGVRWYCLSEHGKKFRVKYVSIPNPPTPLFWAFLSFPNTFSVFVWDFRLSTQIPCNFSHMLMVLSVSSYSISLATLIKRIFIWCPLYLFFHLLTEFLVFRGRVMSFLYFLLVCIFLVIFLNRWPQSLVHPGLVGDLMKIRPFIWGPSRGIGNY